MGQDSTKPVKWLELVAKQHKTWIKIINSFGEYDMAEDIVQEAYIVLYKYASEEKLIKNGVVNRGYMFFTLRSLYFQYYNSKRKITKISLDDEDVDVQIPEIDKMNKEIAHGNFTALIDEHINNWHWYDAKLFKLYRDTDMSIRKIAKETKISWVSIFNTIKNCKQELKEIFEQDYSNLKKENYESIKPTKRQKD